MRVLIEAAVVGAFWGLGAYMTFGMWPAIVFAGGVAVFSALFEWEEGRRKRGAKQRGGYSK